MPVPITSGVSNPTISTELKPAAKFSIERSLSSPASLRGTENPDQKAEPRRESVFQEASSNNAINELLDQLNLPYTLSGGLLVKKQPDNIGDMESQPSIDQKSLAKVYKAILSCENHHVQEAAIKDLLPIVQTGMDQIAHETPDTKTVGEKISSVLKAYSNTLGGRDLALDDTIATVNSFFFNNIENKSGGLNSINKANIASAVATGAFMLAPTLGKNIPIMIDAIKNGDYKAAAMPALRTLAIAAMTTNPVLAAAGLDKASAIAGAIGNSLMIINLPHILHHVHEWAETYNDKPDKENKPFAAFARSNALVDSGTHTALDFLHEVGAQVGFLVLNAQNIAGGGADRNPAVFPLLGVLLGSAVIDMAKGEKPFDDFESDKASLIQDFAKSGNKTSPISQSGRMAVQTKIHEAFDGNFRDILNGLPEPSTKKDLSTQFGFTKLNDEQENQFSKALMNKLFPNVDTDALHQAIDNIFNFQNYDIKNCGSDDPKLRDVLEFIKESRNEDKGYMRSSRGMSSNAFFDKFIAHTIKCAIFEEMQSNTALADPAPKSSTNQGYQAEAMDDPEEIMSTRL